MEKNNPLHVVDRSYLRGIITKCAIIFTAGLILTSVILYLSAHQQLGSSYGEGFRTLTQFKQDMLARSIMLYAAVFIWILVGIIVITLLYSHRVVGPTVRLGHSFKKIADGDFSEAVVLRKNDAIAPLADELNNLITEYRRRIDTLREKASKLRGYAAAFSDTEESPEELLKSVDEIANEAKELKVLLEDMKL